MTPTEAPSRHRDTGPPRAPHIERFSRRMLSMESQRAPVVWLARKGGLPGLSEFPFASVSVLVMLLSLFSLSMYLGGWTWSSWTYAFSLGIALPLVAVELKRKAVITGGAVLLLVFTVIVDAGLPQYFGYSASHLSWYDLTAHFLGAMFMTVFLWSLICWAVSPSGPPKENGRRKFILAVATMLVVSVSFEFTEFLTDMLFGWGNFHPGADTLGDVIFDVAGVVTAAVLISRHRFSVLRRPFWHEGPSAA
ncbi:MAG: hypothetical protein AB7S97_00360 [Thermoplasmata archaeon]